jgi:phosphoglycolate phosphatase
MMNLRQFVLNEGFRMELKYKEEIFGKNDGFSKIKLVIFDVDGTLVDSVGCIVWCMQKAAENCGVPVPSEKEVLNIIGITLRAAVAKLFPSQTDEKIDVITDEYRHLCTRREDETPSPYFPGTLEALKNLKNRGYLLSIATGKSRRGLERLFATEGMRELIDFEMCGDQAKSKPDPMMMELTLKHFGLKPSQALMVGDSNLDLRMALNAGVPSAGVTCGVHDASILIKEDPLVIVKNVAQLARILPDCTGIFVNEKTVGQKICVR